MRQGSEYPPERVTPGIITRLMSEDWHAMTEAANASPNHVRSFERWFRKAKDANPKLDDEQAARLAEMMRTEHYRRMGRLSAQARSIARQAQAEIEATPDEAA